MRVRAALLALLVTAAVPTTAADWYGEFHVGTTRADDAQTVAADERVEGAYGVGVGVRFSRWFATQLDWHTLGENVDPTPIVCPLPPCVTPYYVYPEHGWALRALPRLPLGERFALELGFGLMRWEGDTSVGASRFEESGTDALYSFGIAVELGDRCTLTVERQRLDPSDDAVPINATEFSWTGATLRYRF